MSNKITPEMGKEAYEKSGLCPMQGDYFPAPGCACALGAIARMKAGVDITEGRAGNILQIYFGLPFSYITNFADGFDGNPKYLDADQEAYDDGKAVWEAVKHLVAASES
jgi:hypothetical protein